MKQQQTNKHSNLHREDQHITVEELWRGWKTSEGKLASVSTKMAPIQMSVASILIEVVGLFQLKELKHQEVCRGLILRIEQNRCAASTMSNAETISNYTPVKGGTCYGIVSIVPNLTLVLPITSDPPKII